MVADVLPVPTTESSPQGNDLAQFSGQCNVDDTDRFIVLPVKPSVAANGPSLAVGSCRHQPGRSPHRVADWDRRRCGFYVDLDKRLHVGDDARRRPFAYPASISSEPLLKARQRKSSVDMDPSTGSRPTRS